MVAFGRDLRAMSSLQQRLMTAQESLERDYSRMREVETRYRLLFQMSSEAVLILDTVRHRVVEANPAARALFGARAEQPSGQTLGEMFAADTLQSVQAHLGAIRADGRAEEFPARLAATDEDVQVSVSLFRQENATLFLVRISAAPSEAASMPDVKRKLLKLVESAPDGFVVTDSAGKILTANAAFLEMAGWRRGSGARRVAGPLGRRFRRGAGRADHQSAPARLGPLLHHRVRGENGSRRRWRSPPSPSAMAASPPSASPYATSARVCRWRPRPARALPRSIEQLTELIGRVPLKDLVRESTDVIEKLCIEAALELTGDNRASAAEMLGLSPPEPLREAAPLRPGRPGDQEQN